MPCPEGGLPGLPLLVPVDPDFGFWFKLRWHSSLGSDCGWIWGEHVRLHLPLFDILTWALRHCLLTCKADTELQTQEPVGFIYLLRGWNGFWLLRKTVWTKTCVLYLSDSWNPAVLGGHWHFQALSLAPSVAGKQVLLYLQKKLDLIITKKCIFYQSKCA